MKKSTGPNALLIASLAEEIRQTAAAVSRSAPASRSAVRERLQALRDAAAMAGVPAAHLALEPAELRVGPAADDSLGEEDIAEILRLLNDAHAGLIDRAGSATGEMLARAGRLTGELWRSIDESQNDLRRLAAVVQRRTRSEAGWVEATERLSALGRRHLDLIRIASELESVAGWMAAQGAALEREPLGPLAFEWRRLAREISQESARPASLEVRIGPGSVARARRMALRDLGAKLIGEAIRTLLPPEQRRRERRAPVATLRLQLEHVDWRARLRLAGWENDDVARGALDGAREEIRSLGGAAALSAGEDGPEAHCEWIEPPPVCLAVPVRTGAQDWLLPLELLESVAPAGASAGTDGTEATEMFTLRCGSDRATVTGRALDAPTWFHLSPPLPPDPAGAVARSSYRQRALPVLHVGACQTASPDPADRSVRQKGAASDD